MIRYYLATPTLGVTVTVDENNIIRGYNPIVDTEFVDRPLDEMLEWMKEQGKVEMMEI